ncbi:MAG: RHS repeat-associated core domain-containing protein, partial [Gammaproteobacteria bacterium]|nr:RHS repeat-associated core domain-containing protein [Gammaproteobacteria bacterium]
NAFFSPDWWQDYAYDRYGNRTGVTKTGSAPQIPLDGLASLGFNTASNRITTAGFEYDPAGNQTRAVVDSVGTQQQYRYDAAGRLAQVLNADGSSVLATYSYGASNQRLKSVEGSVTTYYGWDGGKVIAEYDPSGANALQWRTGYIYLGGRLLATTNGGGTRFHHPDRLGTRLVTDQSNGEIVTVQLTMPFGTMQPFSGPYGGDNSWQHPTKNNPSKRRFTSYDRSDATGMDYAVNRFYQAAQGRFTQVDPIEMGAARLSDPQSLNLYSYCGNDPINHVDPDGLFFGKLFGWIGRALKTVFKVFAVVLAVAAVLAVSWGFGALALKAAIGAGIFALMGWGSGRLAQLAAGIAFPGGGYGGFRTPSTFPRGTGVGGVSSFLPSPKGTSDDPLSRQMIVASRSAVDDALQILDFNSKTSATCRSAIQGPRGESPRDAFTGIMNNKNLTFHPGTDPDNSLRVGKTFPPGGGANATMDIYEPFIDPSRRLRTIQVDRKNVVLTARQFHALTLLHEISHATGRYHHPGDRAPHSSRAISQNDLDAKIYTDCIKGSHIPEK